MRQPLQLQAASLDTVDHYRPTDESTLAAATDSRLQVNHCTS